MKSRVDIQSARFVMPGKSDRRYRLPIVCVSTLAFLIVAFLSAHTPGEPTTLKDFLFVIGIFGVPFAVLIFIVLSNRWGDTDTERASFRNRIAMGGALLAGTSASLFLLLLPFWRFAVLHESLAIIWIAVSVLSAITATACGIMGSARPRWAAIASVLLLPFWGVVAALILKASID